MTFTLSRARNKVLPETVTTESGEKVPIDADFRTVLACMRVLADDELEDSKRIYLLLKWFYRGRAVQNAATLFFDFVRDGEQSENEEEPVMDFEQDADAIWASVLRDYGIDLIEIDTLHWYKFRMLVKCLSKDSALCERISLRTMDLSQYKGKARQDLEKAKRAVALKPRQTKTEIELEKELDECIEQGKDTTDIMRRIREYYEDI